MCKFLGRWQGSYTVHKRVGPVNYHLQQPVPGLTQLVQHEINTPPRMVVHQRPYRVPEARRHAIEEVAMMLRQNPPAHGPAPLWSYSSLTGPSVFATTSGGSTKSRTLTATPSPSG
ncbi:hypothetical protein QTP70_019909 [Hemibagrus guttatus]|uniref:Uncharacterized protein n=1 Tax=Hemibagrus guttatus TaxID=175788 RepID=A0AAE0PPV7_9TELE|nr:hypothetical protein QTP70_019909 [Hemibagrus guttatus]